MNNKSIDNIFTGERFVPGIEDSQLEIEHFQRYYCVLPLVKDKIVLDAACGEGYGSKILSQVAQKVIGIDIDNQAIKRAQTKYSLNNKLEFITESVSEISLLTNSIDVVISFETIEHIPEQLQNQFLNEIDRILKPDGILVMSTPNKAVYSDLFNFKNKFHIKEFYKDEFVCFLKKKFQHIVLYNQYFEVASVIDLPGEAGKDVPYRKNDTYTADGKYFIAVASNSCKLNCDISTVFMNTYPEYNQKVFRILQLQEEVESRNEHLARLDEEIEKNRIYIDNLSSEIEKNRVCIDSLSEEVSACKINLRVKEEQLSLQEQKILFYNQENDRLSKDIRDLRRKKSEYISRINEDERKIDSLNQTILNKEGHIEQLLEVEREYEREKASRTYRLALKFRNASLKLFPLNSKRRFFFKILARGIRHPGMMLKMVNPRRVKNCITILKTEGMDSAENHYRLVEEYEKSRTVPLDQENLEIAAVQETEKQIEEYAPLIFTQYEAPEITIIIPVYNQFDYTYHCLEAILKNSGAWRYEVLIADDCSTDLTMRLAEVVNGVTIIRNQENLHFLRNCNHAAKQARGEYIVFLNNDTQVQKDWLTPLIELMRRDPCIGMTGSKLLYADGYLQEAGGILWKDASAWNYGSRQNPNDSEFNYVHEADYISGAAIMIRTSLWKEIGGFDETFAPAYCEDSDLAFEVRKHGYKVMYQPKSVVVHFEGISNGTDLFSGQKKYQVENQKKFYEKWKPELEQQHFANGTELFLARDRGAGRRHVLVIDHYVPQYDKDAGSKTTFMYLKMLVRKGYHITFLGDNFYQHEPYTTQLQQMGILVLYGPKYAENWKEWLRENIQYFDLFYLNRPHITVKYIDFIRETARGKIIYYGHDLHFLRIQREYEISGDKRLEEEARQWKSQELSIMRKADMNYYPSSIECEEICKIDPAIPVKAITAYVYEQFREVHYDAQRREGLLFVGGFGHGPNLDAVLWFLDKIYPGIYEKTQAPFYIVGSKAPEEITSITTPGVIVKGFVSEEELKELYESCRIAVVPLRYGAGVKGKVVEALYYGIPILTTSVGAEGIVGIENVAVVRDEEEALIEAASSLYQSPDRLKEMSDLSQRYVREKFTTEAVWGIIQEDFETNRKRGNV